MNTLISYSDLPPAEKSVADLYAWGMTKKEVAAFLGKNIRTVENQVRSLFAKTQTRKDSEFSSWYFCSRFNISFDLSPLKKQLITMSLLVLIGFSMMNESNFTRPLRSKTITSTRIKSSKKES